MSLLHPGSQSAAPKVLDIFAVKPTQTGVLKRYYMEISPTSIQQGTSIELDYRSDTSAYCDLSGVLLCGKIRLVKANGQPMDANDVAFPITMYPSSMIKQFDVKLGNKIITLPQQMFPYKALIKTLLTRGQGSKSTQLGAQGFFKHKRGHMNDVLVDGDIEYRERAALFQRSKWVDFAFTPPEEVFEMQKYLINNVRVNLRIILASPDFLILSSDPAKTYKYEVSGVVLKMPLITVSPGVILGHATGLQTQNARYPYIRVEMSNQSVGRGESNVNIYNICRKSVPSRLVFAIVSAEAYNGTQQTNPFYFKPYDILSVSLIVNDTVANGAPLEMNFDEAAAGGRQYVLAYNQMFTSTGTHGSDFGNDITIEDFKDGYTLFCYNLDPFENPGDYYNLIDTGFVRLSIQFRNPLAETVVLVIYSEHQDMFEIDAARNVLVN